jgi:hypothetical protein
MTTLLAFCRFRSTTPFPQHFLFIEHGRSYLIGTAHARIICDCYMHTRISKFQQTLTTGEWRIISGKSVVFWMYDIILRVLLNSRPVQ